MAAVEVASGTSAFQAEKVEEPIKNHELESNTDKETETASAEPISEEPVKGTETASPESTPEEPVKETETAVAEAAGEPAEAEAEVETKVFVVEETDVNLQEEPVGGETAKVAPEPQADPEAEPAAEETTKEAEPETKVNAEETEPSDFEGEKPAGEVEEEKVGDEGEAATEKSDE